MKCLEKRKKRKENKMRNLITGMFLGAIIGGMVGTVASDEIYDVKKKAMKEISSFTADKLNFCYSELTAIQNRMEFNPSIPLVFCRIAAILAD